MSKLNQHVKTLKEMRGSSVAETLLLALAMESRKGELYQNVADELHKAWPFSIEKDSAGKYSFKYPDGFPTVVGYLTMQFPVWPQQDVAIEGGTIKKNMGFTAVGDMKKKGTLSKDQSAAYDAINRFNSWYTGFKLSTIREKTDEEFQAQLAERENALLASVPKTERKNAEVVEKVKKQALEEVKAANKPAPNPRLFDGKGNVNVPMMKNVEDTKLAGVVVELAKEKADTIIAALAKAGRPVVEAKSINELHASFLLTQLEKHLTSGEFTKPGEAKAHIQALQKLLAVNGAKEVSKGKATKKVANA